jgi:hypothetical protein
MWDRATVTSRLIVRRWSSNLGLFASILGIGSIGRSRVLLHIPFDVQLEGTGESGVKPREQHRAG